MSRRHTPYRVMWRESKNEIMYTKIIKYLYRRARYNELIERLISFEDCVAHRGNELGEEKIVAELDKEITKLKEEPVWYLA